MTQVPCLAGDWGICARATAANSHCIRYGNGVTRKPSYIHNPTTLHFMVQKKCTLWIIAPLLVELVVPDNWSLGSSNAIPAQTSSTWYLYLNLVFEHVYLGLKTTDIALHDPSFQLTVGHHSACFCWHQIKEMLNGEHHSKGTVTESGTAGQSSIDLASCRMWHYLG